VRDTGAGISADEQAELFRPFHQGQTGESRGGTGLGLTIAQRLVALMDGELGVVSRPGEGSCFSFSVPLPAAEVAASDRSRQAEGIRYRLPEGRDLRVLVADDVEDNRVILQRLLQDMGAEVILAQDGREALSRIVGDSFDIVFLDIRMPLMDGRDVVREVRRRGDRAALPIVAISASVLEHERADFEAAGFDDFIGKPFELSRLADCLQTQLHLELQELTTSPQAIAEVAEDFDGMALSTELHGRMLDAARLSRVTALEDALQELERLGPAQSRLATRIRAMRQRFDTQGIAELLERVPSDG